MPNPYDESRQSTGSAARPGAAIALIIGYTFIFGAFVKGLFIAFPIGVALAWLGHYLWNR